MDVDKMWDGILKKLKKCKENNKKLFSYRWVVR